MLQTVFQLLYTRLGFLHETVGRIVYGAAWGGRRRHVVPTVLAGPMLDVGCGEGWLLLSDRDSPVFALGIDASEGMARRARRRGVSVVQAISQALPLRSGAIAHVVVTYPGPWIIDLRTWEEIARVTVPGATVTVLVGGDISRGRGAFLRSRLIQIAYGAGSNAETLPALGNADVTGDYATVDDRWGTALLWTGIRSGIPDNRSPVWKPEIAGT